MQITIAIKGTGKLFDPIDLPINEEEAMKIFNIKDKKDTYLDSNGLLELHSDDAYIYTDLKVEE